VKKKRKGRIIVLFSFLLGEGEILPVTQCFQKKGEGEGRRWPIFQPPKESGLICVFKGKKRGGKVIIIL